jgi:hypothetical protein
MLIAAWQEKDHVPRWTELIIATAQHDDQEMFWSETQHLTDIGAPLDFAEAELDTARMQAQLVIDNAYRQGVWIALLISMHNSFLYEPMRGQDAKLDEFLDRQLRVQDDWRKRLGYSRKEVETAYSFLSWADRLSLILCRREIPERERELDVAPGPDGKMIRVMQRDDETLVLNPWIFEENEVRVSIEVRRLRQLKFKSEQELHRMLDKAEIEVREWHFKK